MLNKSDVITKIVYKGIESSTERVAEELKEVLSEHKKVDIGFNAARPNQNTNLKIMTIDGTYKIEPENGKELLYLAELAMKLASYFPDGNHKITINDKLWKKMGGKGHPGPKHKGKFKR
ncbi:MAG: hypothetical protein J7J92_01645 [Candidatus Aenigmarchaeota archaeon]|nr:hypothetical protein [Candidatus Aenigmarchaeota archaeon]